MKSLDTFLVGCTSLGILMSGRSNEITEPQLAELEKLQNKETPLTYLQELRLKILIAKRDGTADVPLSVQAKKYLLRRYSRFKYGKRYKIRTVSEMKFSALLKGKLTEKSAKELLSEIDECEYYAVKTAVKNDYLNGYLDVLDAPTVAESSRVIEIKNSFDIVGFMMTSEKELPKSIWYQAQGYMAITDKDICEVCFCLCDFPDFMIAEQRKIVFEAMCPDGVETVEFLNYWHTAEASMRFSDIPAKERIFSRLVRRDEDAIQKIYKRVLYCRKWLQEWSVQYDKKIKQRFTEEENS